MDGNARFIFCNNNTRTNLVSLAWDRHFFCSLFSKRKKTAQFSYKAEYMLHIRIYEICMSEIFPNVMIYWSLCDYDRLQSLNAITN